MGRRAFLGGLGILATPLPVQAQQSTRVYRIGVLVPSAAQWVPRAYTQALRDLGYEEGRNLAIIVRDAGGRLEALPPLARELVQDNVDLIVAINTPSIRAAIRATGTIPIVMSEFGDPAVAADFGATLRRSGGNVTGVSLLASGLMAKRLELLKEAVPNVGRIAILLNPEDPLAAGLSEETKVAARRLGIELRFFAVRTDEELERAFTAMIQWRAQAVLRLFGQAFALANHTIELQFRYRLPTMLSTKQQAIAGALMSYDPDRAEIARRAAYYVDKILKGAKPGDLAVEQPTKFELVINLKTAKALGLTIPPALLQRADQAIE